MRRHSARHRTPLVLSLVLTAAAAGQDPGLRYISPASVRLDDPVWNAHIEVSRRATFGALWEACETGGRFANFRTAAGEAADEHMGGPAADADVYRLIEAAALHLARSPDAALRARVDALVASIAAAQEERGYLHTYGQSREPRQRWRDLKDGAELYSAGALISAALAWRETTGSDALLTVAIRLAQVIDKRFRDLGVRGVPGRCGIESALIDLSAATGEERWLELARNFLEVRGDVERRDRYGKILQDDLPILDQRIATGAVANACVLYTAVADFARVTSEVAYLRAAQTFWDDVARRKTYVTGAIGAGDPSAFGEPFVLPIAEASCPAAAAVGYARWAERQFLLNAHATHADTLELLLHNVLLAAQRPDSALHPALPLSGGESIAPEPASAALDAGLELARWLPGLPGRVYAADERNVFVMLYLASEAEIEIGGARLRITQETRYPADGKVLLKLEPEASMDFTLNLRVPGWCEEQVTVGVGDALTLHTVQHGHDPGAWLTYTRRWDPGDEVTIELPLNPERIPIDPRREDRAGLAALRRGPVVYAFPAADNVGGLDGVVLEPRAALAVGEEKDPVRVPAITARGTRLVGQDARLVREEVTLTAVPYARWAHGLCGPMRVWLPAAAERATLAGEAPPARCAGRLLRSSHHAAGESLADLLQGREPRSSSDVFPRRVTFAGRLGTQEWVVQDFGQRRTVSGASVYWCADGEALRLPVAWRVEYLEGLAGEPLDQPEPWKPVKLVEGDFEPRADAYDTVRFEPVRAASLRLSVELAPEATAGLFEWRLEVDGEWIARER